MMDERITDAIDSVRFRIIQELKAAEGTEWKMWELMRTQPRGPVDIDDVTLAFEVPPKKSEMVVKVIGFKSPIDLITRDLVIGSIVLINMEPTFVPNAKKYGDFEKALGAMAEVRDPYAESDAEARLYHGVKPRGRGALPRLTRESQREMYGDKPMGGASIDYDEVRRRQLAVFRRTNPTYPIAPLDKCPKCGWRLVADGRGGQYCQKCEAGENTLAAIADTLRGEASDAAKYDRLAQQAAKESDEAEARGNPELSKELTVASRMFSAIARDEVKHKAWQEGMALKIRGAQRSK